MILSRLLISDKYQNFHKLRKPTVYYLLTRRLNVYLNRQRYYARNHARFIKIRQGGLNSLASSYLINVKPLKTFKTLASKFDSHLVCQVTVLSRRRFTDTENSKVVFGYKRYPDSLYPRYSPLH